VTDEAYFLVTDPTRMADLGYVVAVEPSEVSLDEVRVARTSLRRACRELGLDDARIRTVWHCQAFADTEGARRTKSGMPVCGFFDPQKDWQVSILVGMPLRDLRLAVFHEAYHLWQHRRYGPADSEADVEWREQDADRWADAMMARQ
jgi:hypothetical protein